MIDVCDPVLLFGYEAVRNFAGLPVGAAVVGKETVYDGERAHGIIRCVWETLVMAGGEVESTVGADEDRLTARDAAVLFFDY